jgi:methanogenic corrinoid protein MtbC1
LAQFLIEIVKKSKFRIMQKPREMSDPFYEQLFNAIQQENKEASVTMALNALSKGEINIVKLYAYLADIQNKTECTSDNEDLCIWQEHIRTAIVRTIMDAAYPYVIKERDARCKGQRSQKVIVLCPKDELHELGAMMVADYFSIAGFDVTFVGPNTPWQSVLAAIHTSNPTFVAISITNPYHISKTRKMIEEIKAACGTKLRIIVGGRAFKNQELDIYKKIGADIHLKSFEDICNLEIGKSTKSGGEN